MLCYILQNWIIAGRKNAPILIPMFGLESIGTDLEGRCKQGERKNVERIDINKLDPKGKNFILFNKQKHRYIDDDDEN